MARARLMNTPADYERLHINQGPVELREDGQRDNFRAGTFEWWYFDAILDDGSNVAACYCTKVQPFTNKEGLHPSVSFNVTTPDGRKLSRKVTKFDKNAVSLSKERCDVRFGNNIFAGDLHDYHIKAAPVKGLGFDVKLHSTQTPWRGDTGYIGFGDHDEKYFTWLCVVPSGTVEGTVTIDGVEHKVTGRGYHDHQWGTTIQFEFLNHWLWSRHKMENHNILVFDFVMNEKYDHTRIPLVFVEDNDGKIIFESTDNVQCKIEREYFQKVSGENFPAKTHYTFTDGDKTLDYVIDVKDELDGRYIYKSVPFFLRGLFKGSKPKYGRYLADGTLTLYENGVKQFTESSELIYEFAYVGENYRKYMET